MRTPICPPHPAVAAMVEALGFGPEDLVKSIDLRIAAGEVVKAVVVFVEKDGLHRMSEVVRRYRLVEDTDEAEESAGPGRIVEECDAVREMERRYDEERRPRG